VQTHIAGIRALQRSILKLQAKCDEVNWHGETLTSISSKTDRHKSAGAESHVPSPPPNASAADASAATLAERRRQAETAKLASDINVQGLISELLEQTGSGGSVVAVECVEPFEGLRAGGHQSGGMARQPPPRELDTTNALSGLALHLSNTENRQPGKEQAATLGISCHRHVPLLHSQDESRDVAAEMAVLEVDELRLCKNLELQLLRRLLTVSSDGRAACVCFRVGLLLHTKSRSYEYAFYFTTTATSATASKLENSSISLAPVLKLDPLESGRPRSGGMASPQRRLVPTLDLPCPVSISLSCQQCESASLMCGVARGQFQVIGGASAVVTLGNQLCIPVFERVELLEPLSAAFASE